MLRDDVMQQLLASRRRRHALTHRTTHEAVDALFDVAQQWRHRTELHGTTAAGEARLGGVAELVVGAELTEAVGGDGAAAGGGAADAGAESVVLDHVHYEMALGEERLTAAEAAVAHVLVTVPQVVTQLWWVAERCRTEGTPATQTGGNGFHSSDSMSAS